MRVDLGANSAVRCLDGTRPVMYIDPAADGPSNDWLITLTGGGACSAQDLDQNGSFESGQECADIYADPGERDEMGTASEPAMKNLGNLPGGSEGILRPDLATNPVFARFNRVRIEKCSYDRYNGSATHVGLAVTLSGGQSSSYRLFQHGQLIMNLALDALRGGAGVGLSYPAFAVVGNAVVPTVEQLPALGAATRVLFVGHSGAAHGLYHNVDRLAARMDAWPEFAGDVRVLHESNWVPGAENEAAFDLTTPSGLFSQTYVGTSDLFTNYDAGLYYRNSMFTEQYRAWMANPNDLASIFDASCVSAHMATNDTWKCRDRMHVRLHHITTPGFLREDFSDPNSEHTANGQGHIVQWGPLGNYAHCGAVGFTPCPPLMAVGAGSPYRARLERQAQQLIAGYPAGSELATGADNSGPAPTLSLWMPDCREHGSSYDEIQFQQTRMISGAAQITLRETLESFISLPRTGSFTTRVDGLNAEAECGPRLLANSFE